MNWFWLALASACLAALLMPGIGSTEMKRLNQITKPQKKNKGLRWGFLAIAVLLGSIFLGGFRLTGWITVIFTMAGTITWLSWRSIRETKLTRRRRDAAQAAQAFAAQLRIGQLPHNALLEVASDFTMLKVTAETLLIGGDVGDVLLDLGEQPGFEGLATVAHAWQLAVASGAPIADLVEQVAKQLREDEAIRATIAAEVSGARTAGRLLAVLPLAAISLGYMAGANPVQYLVSTSIGQVLCIVGVGACATGIWWLEHMADSAEIARP